MWLIDPSNLSVVDNFNTTYQPVRQTYMKGSLYVLLTDTETESSSIVKIGTSGVIARYNPSIGVCYDITSDDTYLYILSAGGGVYVLMSIQNS